MHKYILVVWRKVLFIHKGCFDFVAQIFVDPHILLPVIMILLLSVYDS